MSALYVHIPFCVRKCEYCDFYSEAAGERDIERYLDALEREFRLRHEALAPRTIFIGGGTPTRLSAAQLTRLGQTLKRHVDFARLSEFTVEINPGTLDERKAAALAEMGVTRASFGVQSFDPGFLRQLGRIYEAGKAETAVKLARASGIARISMDLMFALPGQTLDHLRDDLRQALALGTEHLSLYALTFEDDTPMSLALQRGEIEPCPEELEREMFTLAGEACAASGLMRYEVSNFARIGAQCRHNLAYWRQENWRGYGAGAHGMVDGEIAENAADHEAYARCLLDENRLPVVRRERLSPAQRAETLLLMGLRLTEGVALDQFERLAGSPLTVACGESCRTLARLGLLDVGETHVRCTEEGLLVLDRVILDLATELGAGVAR
ncbi:radical SAM family heme chaperone HemW [bacterium]|nr:MAG: radical SAM family heme chaperone HemW [bacterium]RIK62437.1 MAG: coproporphyrinogen III oxidase [Planctomycetota bacterium]